MLFSAKDVVIERKCVLGRGSTGVVYKGVVGPTSVAAKTFGGCDEEDSEPGRASSRTDSTDERAGFMADLAQEITCMIALNSTHPNVAAFVGACFETPFIFYELLPGCDLEQYYRLKSAGSSQDASLSGLGRAQAPWRPTMGQGLCWGSQLFQALEFLHTNPPPLVHRDVKPSNLMLLDDEQTIKLIDLGFGVLGFSPPSLPSPFAPPSLPSPFAPPTLPPPSPHPPRSSSQNLPYDEFRSSV